MSTRPNVSDDLLWEIVRTLRPVYLEQEARI